MFETLEPRRLFTVTVVEDQGVLLITGTDEYESLFLTLHGDTATVRAEAETITPWCPPAVKEAPFRFASTRATAMTR
jgi:hypothetical protein